MHQMVGFHHERRFGSIPAFGYGLPLALKLPVEHQKLSDSRFSQTKIQSDKLNHLHKVGRGNIDASFKMKFHPVLYHIPHKKQ